MTRLADVLRDARGHARLSEELMSSLVGIEEARARELEAGEDIPTPDELDAYARTFGLRTEELAQGHATRTPLMSLFFRSATQGGLESLRELIAADGQFVIGEFMRCVRDTHELEIMLGQPTSAPLPVPPRELCSLDQSVPYGADRLAEWLRATLGLGIDPIASMIKLSTDGLGIRIFWVTPDELHPVIDGASTLSPRPSILANLVEGPDCWWRTRMTLGHEICHLLCDHDPQDDRFAIFSPRALNNKESVRRWSLYDDFERVERRASAFAACLLSPAEAVKKAVGSGDPTSEEAISAVGHTFGLGRTTAINRLHHVFRLSPTTRRMMAGRSASHWTQWEHPDRVREGIGLRAGVVARLALDAFARGRLDRVQVRGYLKLPLTEPLPEHSDLSPAQRAPLRRVEDRVRGIVQQYLQEDVEGGDLCFATDVTAGDGSWRVDVVRRVDGNGVSPEACGHVLVSYDQKIDKVNLNLATTQPNVE